MQRGAAEFLTTCSSLAVRPARGLTHTGSWVQLGSLLPTALQLASSTSCRLLRGAWRWPKSVPCLHNVLAACCLSQDSAFPSPFPTAQPGDSRVEGAQGAVGCLDLLCLGNSKLLPSGKGVAQEAVYSCLLQLLTTQLCFLISQVINVSAPVHSLAVGISGTF